MCKALDIPKEKQIAVHYNIKVFLLSLVKIKTNKRVNYHKNN